MFKVVVCAFAIAIAAQVPAKPTITVGFSPSHGQNALDVVLKTINSARRTIDVAAYSFTSKPVATALVTASKRGISVRVSEATPQGRGERLTVWASPAQGVAG